ncbi:MAG: HAMP domain-containing histidine kinase [Bradyrhizobium sp.]|uniref:sensor histidine kinase n=1 Tax=Bradyrhizobium sp. TaxID=376 RepID=UPI001C2A4410|nr:HAMP domain-containing sensor histidine kinase [Bradyrhizobium sp.]MBU6463143.1 HAMP domain-containing histidine kinase [Pseudomonadota bacterium]MDE2068720.1 HAMP domain-containing histidine kinase [Bradyrhizobium sp.]MDE2243291.1 HAMP domain-containing histidine kinase [Bradyrhizobium sp.]MDE2469538.1 HAMP domain-containing histidine kinase [Bradyrhizobium sp.]
MSKSADKPEVVQLPAEAPMGTPVNTRRVAAQRVREARDRLTSTSGTRPAFDRELLRQYAQTRISASYVVMLLVVATGLLFGFWMQPISAAAWTFGMLCIHAVIMRNCSRFLAEPASLTATRKWRTRFVLLDLLYGLSWTVILIHPTSPDMTSHTLMMFLMLLVIAVSSMLAANLPIAALVATAPVTTAIAVNFALSHTIDNYVLALLALAAEGYFALLARRLHSTTLDTLQARAEKDALIGELEQAKAISDEARHRAESANIAKSRFLAQMSHELRTPLNAILGFSEVMKSEIFGEHVVPIYKEYSADIHNSGVHLLNLINEILDLSRIEAGRYELNEEAVSLVHVVSDCHHLLKLRASNRHITIHEVFEHGMPRIWGDERATRQIVLNLLSNSIKFTPQGGEIWLKVGWTASGGQYLSVKDTGSGIAADEIPIVLASFGQGSNSIKSAEQGAGLGLPIAKSLIDMHGGTFTLKSKLRVGTEVIVTFPPERVMSALAPMAEEPSPPLQPEPTDEKRRARNKPIMSAGTGLGT